ncbi:hypothetical protein CRM22_003760 [Opisthorchis felineus]|uniref:Peptidase A1 domain-containing protein n=1 Tax=Opisthorchis felineus TaxID=147828 RepID=A0A4S2LZR1_OPIFE|nr:hypothetical protein CRM22_003760 [Opisthorchis felineus]
MMVSVDVGRATWKIYVLRLSTSERLISSKAFSATLDSSTWLNKASVNRARVINTALGATLSGNLYVVDCNKVEQLPALIIAMQGVELNLTPQQYIQKITKQADRSIANVSGPNAASLIGYGVICMRKM